MKKQLPEWSCAPTAIAVCGTVGTVVLLTARVALMPLLRDTDTGRFANNVPAMVIVAVVLLAMALFSLCTARERIDVPASRALPTGLAAVLAGGLLGASSLLDIYRYYFEKILPPPGQMQMNTFTQLVLIGYLLFGVLGAIALVRFGLLTISEGGTRRGMSAFGALAPVMWVWFRLAWYEMSYANTVGWSEKFYDFLMVIFELLFLFKLARFASGVGKTTTGGMLFLSMAAALFALSGPLTRVLVYFTSGVEAYQASNLAGVADFGIGLLAYAFGWALRRGYFEVPVMQEDDEDEEPLDEDDNAYDSLWNSLFILEENESLEDNQP